jgi:hypothetical protein
MRRLALVLSVGALLGLSGCGEKVFGPGTGDQASVVLTCDPNPVVAGVSGSGATWAARYEAVLQEYGDVSATIVSVHGIVFDDATGLQLGASYYDSSDLKVFSGGDALDAKGTKRVLQQIAYSTSGENKSAASMTIQVRLRDSKGFETTQSILVKVQ